MPPLAGFFPKALAIIALIDFGIIFLVMVLIFRSLFTLYAYLSIFFSFFVNRRPVFFSYRVCRFSGGLSVVSILAIGIFENLLF